MGTQTKRIQYLYDNRGHRKALIDHDGGRCTYSYDSVGRISVVQNPQGERTSYAYDPAGRRTLKLLANGTRASFAYDPAGNLTKLYNLKSDGTVISSFDYQYDKVGNRTAVLEADGSRVTWSYDATYQLTGEHRTGSSPYRDTYTYDPTGNRLLKIHDGARTTSAYDAANQLTYSQDVSGRTTYTFDADGNQQGILAPNGDRTTYAWDYENRMTSVRLPSGLRNTMAYEPEGLRVKLEESTGTKKFVWDEQNYLAETDSANDTQVVYTNEPRRYGNLVSQRRLSSGVWTPHWYHFDAIGSTRELTTAGQVVSDTRLYDAWGRLENGAGASAISFQYVGALGYHIDSDTAQHFVRARHYLSSFGQWMSPEPTDPAATAEMRMYASNNPVLFVDPSGRIPIIVVGGVGVVAIGGVWWYRSDPPGNFDWLKPGETASVMALLRDLESCAGKSSPRLVGVFRNCGSLIGGKFEKGGGPDGDDGSSLTRDPGWAWPTRIYLAADFFERSNPCDQYYTLVKECYLRAVLRDFDDTALSDNRHQDAFLPLECCLACCGHVNPVTWPRRGTSCCPQKKTCPPEEQWLAYCRRRCDDFILSGCIDVSEWDDCVRRCVDDPGGPIPPGC